MGSTVTPDTQATPDPPGTPDEPRRYRLYSMRILARVFYPALLLVIAWGVAWTMLIHRALPDILAGEGALGWIRKGRLEAAALWLLGIALGVVALRWCVRRDTGLLWFTALVAVFFARELHFAGSSAAVYPGVALLGVIALYRPRWTEGMLTTRLVATLLVGTIVCYGFAVSLDGHWWFDWSQRWLDAGVLSEEVLELTGHAMILTLAFTAPRANPEPVSATV